MNIDDMVVWLGVQLDADEQAAKAATPGPWSSDPTGTVCADVDLEPDGSGGEILPPGGPREVAECYRDERVGERGANADHIARHDPSAVLADVAAKKAIVDNCATEIRHVDRRLAAGLPVALACSGFALQTLKMLAAGYRHRDGYDEGWAS